MSLRFFCDQCVPTEISRGLNTVGHDVLNLRDALPVHALDADVLAKAQELDRILVSLDGDFSDIVAYPPDEHAGILAIQLHNHPEIIPQLMERLTTFLESRPEQKYYRAKLFIVEVHRVQIRH